MSIKEQLLGLNVTYSHLSYYGLADWKTFEAGIERGLRAAAEFVEEKMVKVSIGRMKLSDGRTDYFVVFECDGRRVTPHVFREEYKAAYHVALYEWMLNGGEEPGILDFDEKDFPAQNVIELTVQKPRADFELVRIQSESPVPSHGGPALGVSWELKLNGVVLDSEYNRYYWKTNPRENEKQGSNPPDSLVWQMNKLKEALGV